MKLQFKYNLMNSKDTQGIRDVAVLYGNLACPGSFRLILGKM